MGSAKKITLGGRGFISVSESTVEHDYWVLDKASDAGLTDLKLKKDETPEAFAMRLMRGLTKGPAFEIIGGLIIPEDTKSLDWTPELAQETAAFVRKLSDPEDKRIINGMVAQAYLRFFESGMHLLRVSELYSKLNPATHPGEGKGREADTESGNH